MEEIPIIISDHGSKLFGILRTSAFCKKLVILLPAATGTRIGPQRLYVQIGRALLKEDVASLTIDLPPNGDSYEEEPKEFHGTYKERLTQHYQEYLTKITGYLNTHFRFEEYVMLSISVGCIPVLKYAQLNRYSRVILLSPNHFPDEAPKVNKKNAKAYLKKIFLLQTWKKFFSFRISLSKVIVNIFGASLVKKKGREKSGPGFMLKEEDLSRHVNILNIFGAKDDALQKSQLYWQQYLKDNNLHSYTEKVIVGADHSFFGWPFKIEVCQIIVSWLLTEKALSS